jgi:hypothetical protein
MALALRYDDKGNLIQFTAAVPLESPGHLHILGQNELRFYEGANYVGFEAPALDADRIWILPNADGTSGQVLQTAGPGGSSALSWVTRLANVVEDTTPQLGGFLDCQNNYVSAAKTIQYNGTGPVTQSGVTGAVTVDWNNGQKQRIIFGAGNITTLSFTDLTSTGPCNLLLWVTQDSTGGRTIGTWDADVRWSGSTAPTLTTTGSRTDLFAFAYTGSALHLYGGVMTPDFNLT